MEVGTEVVGATCRNRLYRIGLAWDGSICMVHVGGVL